MAYILLFPICCSPAFLHISRSSPFFPLLSLSVSFTLSLSHCLSLSLNPLHSLTLSPSLTPSFSLFPSLPPSLPVRSASVPYLRVSLVPALEPECCPLRPGVGATNPAQWLTGGEWQGAEVFLGVFSWKCPPIMASGLRCSRPAGVFGGPWSAVENRAYLCPTVSLSFPNHLSLFLYFHLVLSISLFLLVFVCHSHSLFDLSLSLNLSFILSFVLSFHLSTLTP